MKNKLTRYQLFSLIVLIDIGSSTLFVIGGEAKNDALIAIVIGTIGGLLLLWIYIQIFKAYPDKNFTEIIFLIMGKRLGLIVVLLYILYFLFFSLILLTEFGYLTTITILQRTPQYVVLIVFYGIVSYYCIKGINVIGRTGEIMATVMLCFLSMIYLFVFISGKVDYSSVQPVFGSGAELIVKTGLLHVAFFPFGDSFPVFALFKYASPKNNVGKIYTYGFLLTSVFLLFSTFLILATLGLENSGKFSIPLFEVIKTINIKNIVTNLDAIGVSILFIGGFYKTLLYLYVAIQMFSSLIKTKKIGLLLLILAPFYMWYAMTFMRSFIYHRWLHYLFAAMHRIYFFLLPLSLLILLKLRQRAIKG